MTYSVAYIKKMTDDVLLAAWESIHGTHLSCKCRYCNGPQPISKFKNQIRKWCEEKHKGLSSSMSVPRTCDYMSEENEFLNPINNPYYAEVRKLKKLDLPKEELAERLAELTRIKDEALVIARARLAAARATREKPKVKPKILTKRRTVREAAVVMEAERRLTILATDLLFEQQVQDHINKRIADNDMVEARITLRVIEMQGLF